MENSIIYSLIKTIKYNELWWCGRLQSSQIYQHQLKIRAPALCASTSLRLLDPTKRGLRNPTLTDCKAKLAWRLRYYCYYVPLTTATSSAHLSAAQSLSSTNLLITHLPLTNSAVYSLPTPSTLLLQPHPHKSASKLFSNQCQTQTRIYPHLVKKTPSRQLTDLVKLCCNCLLEALQVWVTSPFV